MITSQEDHRLTAWSPRARDTFNQCGSYAQKKKSPADAVLIVDGTFLQRPELRGHWDLTIFLKTSADTAERRAVGRDAEQSGGIDALRKLYAERYRGAFDLYECLCAPEEIADVVLMNDDIDRPEMFIQPDCLLGCSL
jgi:uridine kinase